MIRVSSKGSFKNTKRFFKRCEDLDIDSILKAYGEAGVNALSSATPIDSGKTAESWGYEIEKTKDIISIHWTNSNVDSGVNVAVLIQYGHGTGTGGYVQGIDYINPALKPVFESISEKIWKEVTK